MKFGIDVKIASIVGAAALAALTLTAPAALAEPVPPAPPLPVPAPAPMDAEVPAQVIATGAADTAVEAVPHLPSPENLPPGTSDAPVAPSQPRLTYLRDLWHAMQTQEVSGGDALLLLTQRPMVADATPPAGLPLGPQAPLPAAPAPAPAAPPVSP